MTPLHPCRSIIASSGNFTFSVWLRNTSTGRGGIFSKGTSFQASEFGLAIAGTGGNFTTLGSSDNGKLIFIFAFHTICICGFTNICFSPFI